MRFLKLALGAALLGTALAASAASQQTSVFLKLHSILTSAGDLQTARSEFTYERTIDLANGTGADQANQVFSDTRTLSSGANEELDLSGVLTNAVGESVTFTKVKLILIRNKGTTHLSVGGAASNGFVSLFGDATDIINVRAGGVFLLTAPDATGLAAAGGTADKFKILNSAGASIDYDIVIVGVN